MADDSADFETASEASGLDDSFEDAVAQSCLTNTAASPLSAPSRCSSLIGALHASAAGGLNSYNADSVAAQHARAQARLDALKDDLALSKYALDVQMQVFEPTFEQEPDKREKLERALRELHDSLTAGKCAIYTNSAEARAYCSAAVNLRRFVIDTQFNVEKAFKKLNKTLEWRAKMQPWEYDSSKLEASLKYGAVQLTGTDSWGRPVMVIDLPRAPKEVTSEQLLDLIYAHFEHLRVRVARANGVKKWALIFNIERQTIWNMPSASVISEVMRALLSSFPEFCGNTILWQPPAAFKAVWYTLRPFLEADTLKKIVFVSGDSSPGSKVDLQMRAMLGDEWRQLTEVDHVRGKTRFDPVAYVQNFDKGCEVVRAAALQDPNADYP